MINEVSKEFEILMFWESSFLRNSENLFLESAIMIKYFKERKATAKQHHFPGKNLIKNIKINASTLSNFKIVFLPSLH